MVTATARSYRPTATTIRSNSRSPPPQAVPAAGARAPRRSHDRVGVEVAVSAYGRKYLKTVADGDPPNNLLSLPECQP
jgi:hypothetical protein